MLSPRKIARNHEDVFIEHYQWLLSWALRLAEQDRALAEDLVQDAFVHFTLSRPDLRSIHNLEGYLYSMLRNLHLSQQRRATRNRLQQLSVFEYDTIEAGLLRTGDAVERLQVQDELRRVCHYASLRKETARAASLLILRFFHGYYPSEIAHIARTNRRAVDERLRIARNEARLYITDPGRLKFINDASFSQPPVSREVRAREEFLTELREMIFRSRRGACLSTERLERIYKSADESQISGQHLAHIVSCPDCLDKVNRLLNLPGLNDRHPTDTLGKDSTGGAGGGAGRSAGGDGDGSGTSGFLQKYRRSAREIFEHRPQELYFLINGLILGSQTVNSEWSEQTLDINLSERIAFVEVFSERDTRLHFFPVEPPPEGEVKQPTRVELSDGRSLDLTLSFSNTWPTLHAVYHDPLMTGAPAGAEEQAEEEAYAFASTEARDENHAQAGSVTGGFQESGFIKTGERLASFLSGARVFWLRPGLITALLAIVLISTLVLVKMRAPVEGAGELLRLSAAADAKLASNADIVLHRKMSFEERRGETNELVASYSLDVWQSAARELTVRRVYDAEGNLVTGEWTRADGASIVYSHAGSPQQRTAPGLVAKAILETGEIWRLDASAASFGALVERVEAVKVEERGPVYVLSYEADAANGKQALRRATLTLRKADLRAIGQTLTVERDGEVRQYKFGEEFFERFPKAHVGHTIFQPEPALLGPSGKREGSDAPQSQSDAGSSTAPAPEVASPAASRELEIEVSYLLNRVRADLGEQIALTRTTGGQLRVEALVETERRKEEILRALGPVLNNRAVVVRVSTIDEAVSRQRERRGQNGVTEREVEIQTTRIPADAELRRYFSGRADGADVDEKINQFANRMLSRSRQARAHASQLERLAGRFSPAEIRALAPEARAKWLSMIRGHAEGLRRELALMRQDLRAVFATNAGADVTRETITEANLVQTSARLARLSSAVDEAVRSAFTLSADGRTAAAMRDKEFWQTLATAEGLAASIQDVYR